MKAGMERQRLPDCRRCFARGLLLLASLLVSAASPTDAQVQRAAVVDDLVSMAKAVRLDQSASQREKSAAAAALMEAVAADPANREAHRLLADCYQVTKAARFRTLPCLGVPRTPPARDASVAASQTATVALVV